MFGSSSTIHIGRLPATAPFYDAEGGGGGGSSQAPAATGTEGMGSPSATDNGPGPMRFSQLDMSQNPLFAQLNDIGQPNATENGQAAPAGNQPGTENQPTVPAAPVQPESVFDFAKVREQIAALNPKAAEKYTTPEALASTVVNQEKVITQHFQDRAQLAKQVENLTAEIERMKNQPPAPAVQPNVPAQMTPEQIAAENDKLLAEMMENPTSFMQKIEQNALAKAREALMPEIEKRFGHASEVVANAEMATRANQLIESFSGAKDEAGNAKYPQFEDYAPEMSEFMNRIPGLKESISGDVNKAMQVMDMAYNYAKGIKEAPATAINPEELLANPDFLKTHVFANEQIRNQFLTEYMADIRSGKAPTTISGSGMPPATPKQELTGFKAATAAAQRFFESRG